jgi:regulator of sirC expression with transglutaminase-like and TPR domain
MLPLMTVGVLPRQHPHRLRAGVLPCLAALLVGLPGFAQAPPDNPVDTPAATPADRSVEELARAAKPAIVTIRFRGRRGGDEGLGTGFFVGAGLVATNLHVIGEARPISVELADGTLHEVTAVHATDRDGDLAVVRIAATGPAPLPLAAADAIAAGAEIVAIGNPHGLERSVVAGRVSGLRQMNGIDMLQLAIPVEPGNSGGPVLDRQGRVQGIVSMKSLVTPNLGFAVRAERLRGLLERPNPVVMERWLTIGAIDPDEWTTVGGARWRQRAGRIAVAGAGVGFGGRSLCLAVAPSPDLPCDVAVWVKLDDEAGAAGLVFASDGGDRHYGFYPTAGRLRLTRFDGPDVLSWKILAEKPSPHYRPGAWNHLRVRRTADAIACFVNDQPVFESADRGLVAGRVGLAKFRDTEAEFRGFAVGRTVPAALPSRDVLDRVEALTAGLPDGGPPGRELVGRLLAERATVGEALAARAALLERQARQLEALAVAVHERRTLDELARVVAADEPRIDLFHAALLVAKLDNPELDVAASTRDLDRLVADIAKRSADADETMKLATLNRVLFEELGFHGSRGDYYNRSNSYVNEVLDDREGIPITLSVVYMELARRLGLRVEGVGFPGHFLVRSLPAAGEPRWLDVFDRAAVRSRDDLARQLREQSGDELTDEHLATVGPRAILVRMLSNLRGIATREGKQADVLRYLDATLAVDPLSVRDRLMRMVTAARLGRRETATEDARWLLDRKPDGIDLAEVRGLLEQVEADAR